MTGGVCVGGVRVGGLRELAHRVPDRARPRAGYQNPRLCGRRPNPWRRPVVHHVVGNPAQRPWPADRGFLLRIGYTTILLGTLGFFGLGLESESPDWGTTINAGRRLLALYPHAAIAPALSLLTLVLGLNLLADGLREESLRD